jgi:hypothetical protein
LRDDWVEVAIDTFNDQRRGYLFDANPLGVQWDALWTEGAGEDPTFDTVYHSNGMVTDRGYVIWMAIPFKSLRFPQQAVQRWGIQFRRFMPRVPELVSWPHISSRIHGRRSSSATTTTRKTSSSATGPIPDVRAASICCRASAC